MSSPSLCDVPSPVDPPASLDLVVRPTAAAAARRKQFFTVGGMTCSSCSGTIERALLSTGGIYSAKISLLTERCEVVFDDRVITANKIIEEIEDVGFEASVSGTVSKGKISLHTAECLSPDTRALLYKGAMEQVGVLDVVIAPRTVPPFHDVIEVEFDANQHKLSGPGGSKPVVWQGGASSPAVAAPVDSLGRFSVRALVRLLQDGYGIKIASVRNDGDLEARKSEMKHRRDAELTQWRTAFLQSLLFTVPIALICWVGPFIPSLHASLMSSVHRALTWKALVLWLLVTPVQFGFGLRFYRNSLKAIRHRSANMDVLVALGSSASYFYSLIVCIMCLANDHYAGSVFFETSALLISIVLLGRYVEHMAKGRTSDALSVLMGLQASTATLLQLDESTGAVVSEEEIDVNLVQQDDVLMVHRGAKIPVDGVVVSDASTSVDESLLTGESMPVVKSLGADVIGGTINLEQPIRIRATGVGSETVLFKIVSLVNDAQSSKAPIQAYADYIGSIFVPSVIALSIVVFLFWYSLCLSGVVPPEWKGDHESDFLFSFLFSVSVLLISCPCSLGLATPTAVMVGTGVGAQLGVLFKGGEPLEITGKATTVVLDKTGTLTIGKPAVIGDHTTIEGLERLGIDEKTWWLIVGSVAHQSEHLMSRAIAAHAQLVQQRVSGDGPAVLESVSEFQAQSGGGCGGVVRGKRVLVGNTRWLRTNGVDIDADVESRMEAVQARGNVAVLVAVDGTLSGIISLADAVKPESSAAVRALHARGIDVYMLTGDNSRTALAVGEMVGIPPERVISQVTPADKAEVIKRIQMRAMNTQEHQTGRHSENNNAASDAHHADAGSSPMLSPVPATALLVESDRLSISPPTADADQTQSRWWHFRSPTTTPSAPVVIMIGDGTNDSIALAQSDVGMSIGSGTDIALETASVVLMKNDLCDILTAIDLSQHTLRRIKRNFTWACIYNLLSIPIAAGALYPIVHQGLPPILAAACMGLSSVSVIASSLMLKRYTKPVLADEGGLAMPSPNRLATFFRKSTRRAYGFSSLPSIEMTARDEENDTSDYSARRESEADEHDAL